MSTAMSTATVSPSMRKAGHATALAPAVVVKIGGRVLGDPRLPAALAKRLAASGGRLVIVHGAADEVSALQRTFGVKPAFVNGLRVTSADDINTIRMACSGLANKRLVAALIGAGIQAVGLSGEDASILVAEPAGDGALGAIGSVVSVHTPLLELLLGSGYVPAISPLARAATAANGAGQPAPTTAPTTAALNINADDAAAAIATALGADELLLVADVAHVRAYGDSVTELSQSAAEAAIAAGEIKDGMLVKVRAALGAVARGVPTARIGDVGMIAGESSGTAIVADGGLS
jgi:acetylglutamate kinase